jgi:hypothetical protein
MSGFSRFRQDIASLRKSNITLGEFDTLLEQCVGAKMSSESTYAVMFKAFTDDNARNTMLEIGSKRYLDEFPQECASARDYLKQHKAVKYAFRNILFDNAYTAHITFAKQKKQAIMDNLANQNVR